MACYLSPLEAFNDEETPMERDADGRLRISYYYRMAPPDSPPSAKEQRLLDMHEESALIRAYREALVWLRAEDVPTERDNGGNLRIARFLHASPPGAPPSAEEQRWLDLYAEFDAICRRLAAKHAQRMVRRERWLPEAEERTRNEIRSYITLSRALVPRASRQRTYGGPRELI